MAGRIDLGAIEQRARAALGGLGPWFDPPAAYRKSAAGIAEWLRISSGDLPASQVRSRPFLAARAALNELVAAEELRATAARLWNDPVVNSVVGSEEQKLRLWHAGPEAALRLFAAHSLAHPEQYRNGSSLREALNAIGTAVAWDADHEGEGSGSAPEQAPSEAARAGRGGQTPVPGPKPPVNGQKPAAATPAKEPQSYDELIRAEKLSPAQWSRLMAMAQERHPEDDGSDLLGGEDRYSEDDRTKEPGNE